MKEFSNNELNGIVYLGAESENRCAIKEKTFLVGVIDYIWEREECNGDGIVVVLDGRRVHLKATEIE